jgi:hypothetical protein
MQLLIADCVVGKNAEMTNKTNHLLANLCFADIVSVVKNGGLGRCWFYVFFESVIAKTKQRYIFLLTQLGDSSYLLPQPFYLEVLVGERKRIMIKF